MAIDEAQFAVLPTAEVDSPPQPPAVLIFDDWYPAVRGAELSARLVLDDLLRGDSCSSGQGRVRVRVQLPPSLLV